MQPDSRQTIHMGIAFVLSPCPAIDARRNLKFQQSLIEQAIDIVQVELNDRQIIIIGESSNLNIRVDVIQPPQIGRLTIIAPKQGSTLSLFERQAEAVVKAFEETWPAKSRQIVSADSTFRDLFETSEQHAFMEIWEKLLEKSAESLRTLSRPVLGGGLRFVMPAKAGDLELIETELKVEAYLKNTKKIWVETIFRWHQPMPPGTPLNPRKRLEEVNDYVEGQVISFITGGA